VFTVLALVLSSAGASAAGVSGAQGQTFAGTLVFRHTDSFGAKEARYAPALQLDGGGVLGLAFRNGAVAGVAPGTHVSLRGSRVARQVVVADGSVRSTAASAGTSTSAMGVKRLLVLLVNFANDRTEPLTAVQVAGCGLQQLEFDRRVLRRADVRSNDDHWRRPGLAPAELE
jgi:hypothetical protein